MNLHDMLDQVSAGTGLDREQAETATRAFLETLAVRLGNDEARQLASQLPLELQDCLAPTEPDVEKLSRAQFLARFREAAGLDEAGTNQAARAVWGAITDTVSPGEVADVKSQLPSELVSFFTAASPNKAG